MAPTEKTSINSSRIEFELAQGWSKNLVIAFEGITSTAAAEIESGAYASVKQVHGAVIHEVTAAELIRPTPEPLAVADGLFAHGDAFKKSRKKLVIKTADCIPLVYVDNQNQNVAIVHAGWRGLAQQIHTLPFTSRKFDPKFTWVWMGPSLSGENFDVREDMWKQFPRAASDPKIFSPSNDLQIRRFHAWELVQKDLAALGVELVYNVEVNTLLDTQFSSYRRSRMAGLEKSPTSNYSWVGFH